MRGATRCLSDTVGVYIIGRCSGVVPICAPKVLVAAMNQLNSIPMFMATGASKACGLQLWEFWKCQDETQALEIMRTRCQEVTVSRRSGVTFQFARRRGWRGGALLISTAACVAQRSSSSGNIQEV